MKHLAFAITLALVLAGSAFAQTQMGPAPLWGGSLTVGKIQGFEVTPGTKDFEDQICWGQTFSMMNETSSITIAPDYYFEPAPGPGEYLSKVTSGSWTLVYRGTKGGRQFVHNGMLFGTVTGGIMEWYFDKAGNPTYAEVELQVNVTGGTGTFAGAGGPQTTGTFHGTVEYNGGIPIATGIMEVMF